MLSFGTDWPGTSASEYPINPMLGLYAAVTRQTVRGTPEGGWFPAERISIEDAIRAYTYNTAYANFEEKIKGSIEVGKLGDLAVLSKNLLRIPPQDLLTTGVIYTVVNGKVVYRNVPMANAYVETRNSQFLPIVSGDLLTRFLEQSKTQGQSCYIAARP